MYPSQTYGYSENQPQSFYRGPATMMCDSSNNDDYCFNAGATNISSSTGVFPSIDDFAGYLNFEIILNSNDSARKKWLVSKCSFINWKMLFFLL